jgi:hypothetical protein
MIRYSLCTAFCILLFFSCKEDEPKNLLTSTKMVEVLKDVMKVEAYTKNHIEIDSTKNAETENAKMQMQVFALHKVSKDDFYKSLDYYMNNNAKIQPIFDSIIATINYDKIKQYARPIADTAKLIAQ